MNILCLHFVGAPCTFQNLFHNSAIIVVSCLLQPWPNGCKSIWLLRSYTNSYCKWRTNIVIPQYWLILLSASSAYDISVRNKTHLLMMAQFRPELCLELMWVIKVMKLNNRIHSAFSMLAAPNLTSIYACSITFLWVVSCRRSLWTSYICINW